MRIIAGRFRGKTLLSPTNDSIRPTADRAREAIFNMLTSRLGHDWTGLAVLDLFAGTGAMGLEALSRGAATAVFVDSGTEARGLVRDHIDQFGLGGVTKLLRRDATALGQAGTMGPFDLVFIDPPYGKGLAEKALSGLLEGKWLASDATLVLEEGAAVEVTLPPRYALDERRDYGAAAVYLLHLAG